MALLLLPWLLSLYKQNRKGAKDSLTSSDFLTAEVHIISLLPPLWFFGFLYYTDVPSTVFVVACLLAAKKRRHLAASLVGTRLVERKSVQLTHLCPVARLCISYPASDQHRLGLICCGHVSADGATYSRARNQRLERLVFYASDQVDGASLLEGTHGKDAPTAPFLQPCSHSKRCLCALEWHNSARRSREPPSYPSLGSATVLHRHDDRLWMAGLALVHASCPQIAFTTAALIAFFCSPHGRLSSLNTLRHHRSSFSPG